MIDRLAMVLDSLLSDGQSQRAVAETVIDIRTEHDEVRGVWPRMQWAGRSAVATVRVALRVLPRELAGLAAGGFGVKLGVWALILVLPS